MSIKITNNTFINMKRGIVSTGGADIEAHGNKFINVETPYDIKDANTAEISGTRIKDDPKIRRPELSRFNKSQTGYTKPHGAPLPSYCPECEHVFASSNYVFSGLYFKLWGNEDTCTNCGSESAHLSNGHFELINETVKVLAAPEITREMILRLADIGDQFKSAKLTPDAAIAAVANVSPDLSNVFLKCLKAGKNGIMLFFAIVFFAKDFWELWKEYPAISDFVVEQLLLRVFGN